MKKVGLVTPIVMIKLPLNLLGCVLIPVQPLGLNMRRFSHQLNILCVQGAIWAHSAAQVYKILTQEKEYPAGGTAYISLDNPLEPYNGGTKYAGAVP